ncbi:MAG: hypothetical protein Q9225_004369 [Loekoesia sp. 1 TL-2023]
MGRLNYTNRKTEGLKLGQIIAKDLTKRIPPGTGSKSALRDPIVDLDVTGKCIGEDGFRELAGALIKSLEHDGEHGKVCRLEELCLKTNRLSARCLPALARIVRLAAHDLRDLDLSDNCFSITSSQETHLWEHFLESFAECCVLRRVDLGGNALGPKAFEILARVYTRERLTDPVWENTSDTPPYGVTPSRKSLSGDSDSLNRQARNLSLGSASDAQLDNDERISNTSHKLEYGIRHDSISPEKAAPSNLPDLFHIYSKTQGLRSVPYLILSDTGMTDAGALHLSYIISCHHRPDRLLRHVPPAKSGHHHQQLDFYNSHSGCQGIIYLPNDNVSNPGLKLLELCEGARIPLLNDDRPPHSPEAFQTQFSTARTTSAAHTSSSTTAAGPRRRSGTKGEHDELTDSEAVIAELYRARSRIQGNVLKEVRMHSNDLWRTALRMLGLCRMLCPLRKEDTQTATADEWNYSPVQPFHSPDFPTLPKANSRPFVGYLDPFAPPLTAKSPNMPITPTSKKQPPKLKTATPNPLSITTSPTTASPGTSAAPFRSYRSDLLHGLPAEAWARIIGMHLGADRFMSEKQQRSVLRWATDRKTLARELESLGKPESAQIWKVLDGVGCLAYESDAI